MSPPPPISPLFPYTTLFRSPPHAPDSIESFSGCANDAAYEGLGDTHRRRFAAQSLFVIRWVSRSEEHTSELQSRQYLVCRLLLEKKKKLIMNISIILITYWM